MTCLPAPGLAGTLAADFVHLCTGWNSPGMGPEEGRRQTLMGHPNLSLEGLTEKAYWASHDSTSY